MALVLSIKVALSVLIPASKDMSDIVNFALSTGKPQALTGPWIDLTSYTLTLWQSIAPGIGVDEALRSAPFAMTTDTRLLLLLLRLPSILFDIGVALALYLVTVKTAPSHNLAKVVSLIWFLNPYSTFAIEMIGVPDIAAAFLTVAAILFLNQKKSIIAGLFLGAGIAIKLYSILILPQIILYSLVAGMRRMSRIVILVSGMVGLLIYFTWALLLGLLSLRIELIEYSAVTTPLKSIFDFSGYPINFLVVALVLLYFLTWTFARTVSIPISQTILPLLLTYLAFSEPYPQYLIWALPFLTLDLVLVKWKNGALLAIICLLQFLWGFLTSGAYQTPSNYSLLLIPLKGAGLPWYSQRLMSFLLDNGTQIVLVPLIRAALATAMLIYAIKLIRGWFCIQKPALDPANSRVS